MADLCSSGTNNRPFSNMKTLVSSGIFNGTFHLDSRYFFRFVEIPAGLKEGCLGQNSLVERQIGSFKGQSSSPWVKPVGLLLDSGKVSFGSSFDSG